MKYENYTPHNNSAYVIQPSKKQCSAQVFGKGRLEVVPYQCRNKPKFNGRCGIHKESESE